MRIFREIIVNSCIYKGYVKHRRFKPVENSFRYSLFMMFLDLAELHDVFAKNMFWSYNKPNFAWFRRKDYLQPHDQPLDKTVRDLVEKQLQKYPDGPVRLLTHVRYFGYCFNPVSFYYVYDSDGTNVETIVADITNTPWNERFQYVLDESSNETPGDRKRFQFPKSFHVSPFMDMDFRYDWRFNEPGKSLNIHMINLQDEEPFFDATLTLERHEIDRRSLTNVLFKYPFMTLKVTTMIYWQALKLRLKGAQFYTHPTKRKNREKPV